MGRALADDRHLIRAAPTRTGTTYGHGAYAHRPTLAVDVFTGVELLTWTVTWGSVPDWISALATPMAVGGLLVEAHRSRSERQRSARRSALESAAATQREREHQVIRVSAWIDIAEKGPVCDLVAYVENASDRAIHDVQIRIDGADGLEQKSARVVAPATRVVAGTWLAVSTAVAESAGVVVEFSDTRGIRWRRDGAEYTQLTPE